MNGDDRPLLTAQKFIDAHRFDCAIAPDVVLVFDGSLLPQRSITDRARSRITATQSHPFRAMAGLGDGVDMIVAAGPGASVAAVTVELLAAFGVRRIVSVGAAGALRPLPAGSLHVVTDALGVAGESLGYPPHRTSSGPLSDELIRRVGEPVATLTTNAPFHQSARSLSSIRRRASVIEMEISALLAAGGHRGLDVCSLVAISDRYSDDEWHLGNQSATVSGLRDGVTVATNALVATR